MLDVLKLFEAYPGVKLSKFFRPGFTTVSVSLANPALPSSYCGNYQVPTGNTDSMCTIESHEPTI